MASYRNIDSGQIKSAGAARPVIFGAGVGACLAGVVFFWNLVTAGGFAVMGVTNETLGRIVAERYLGAVVLQQLKIALWSVFVGAGAGAFSGLLLSPILKSASAGRLLMIITAWLTFLHTMILSRAIIHQPQLFTERFYDAGGLPRATQLFLTENVSPSGPVLLIGCAVGLAALAWIPAVPTAVRLVRWARLGTGFGLVVFVVALLAVSEAVLRANRSSVSAGQQGPPNIVVVVVDSLRSDRLSCHGAVRVVAPNIDRLCAEEIDFEQAFVPLPRTFPSIVSMLTGQLPYRHGIRHMFPADRDREDPFDGLPRALASAGYRSAAISDFSGDVLTRLDLGFDQVTAPHFSFRSLLLVRGLESHATLLPYLDHSIGAMVFPELREMAQAADPARIGDEAVTKIKELRGGPFFLFVFFSTPHFPYAAPYPDYLRFTSSDYHGPYRYHKPNRIGTDESLTNLDVEQIRGLYDGAIHSVDRQVGRIVDAIRSEGLDNRTILVVTADHGEHLYEADLGMGHGEHLRGEAALRVPLLIADPQRRGTPIRVTSLTRSIDLVPTLLDRIGLKDDVKRDGVSLMPLIRGDRTDLDLAVFAETGIWFARTGSQFFQTERLDYPDVIGLMEIDRHRRDEIVLQERYRDLIETAKHRMVARGRFKLIATPTRQGVRYALYDRVADPENRMPLDPDVYSGEIQRLRKDLSIFMEADPDMTVRNGFLVRDPMVLP